MKLLEFDHVSLGYGGLPILKEVNFTLKAGEICCLLGSNGSGKSTLLRSVAGGLKPQCGEIRLAGKALHSVSVGQRAKLLSWVPQSHYSPFAFSVLEMVMMGATSGMGLFSVPGCQQRAQARHALAELGISRLEQRLFPTLSGGERQLVMIARALVQQPRLMLLDEPASSLDFGHQIAMLDKIRQLKAAGIALLIATHHPLHASSVADSIVFVSPRLGVLQGSPQVLLTPASMAELYQVRQEEIRRHLNLNLSQERDALC